MKTEQPIYIPATTAGKTWRVETHKPQGRPAYATAGEGELEINNDWVIFKCQMVFDKPAYTRVPIEGPATAKKKAAAIAQLIQQLKDAGQVPQEA